MDRPSHTMFTVADFRAVPLPRLPSLLDRLAEAGWTWEENRANWKASFRKDFPDKKSAEQAGDEMRELMSDYLHPGDG